MSPKEIRYGGRERIIYTLININASLNGNVNHTEFINYYTIKTSIYRGAISHLKRVIDKTHHHHIYTYDISRLLIKMYIFKIFSMFNSRYTSNVDYIVKYSTVNIIVNVYFKIHKYYNKLIVLM